jgi:hypothetical protein
LARSRHAAVGAIRLRGVSAVSWNGGTNFGRLQHHPLQRSGSRCLALS